MNTLRWRRADTVIVVIVLTAALLLFALTRLWATGGTQVVVEAPGQKAAVYPLHTPAVFTVTGDQNITLTVEIRDGKVRVRDSACPDHVCVHTGWLSRGGQAAVCVPAGISLRVVGGTDAVDGVTS